jgi:hypothetical protein
MSRFRQVYQLLGFRLRPFRSFNPLFHGILTLISSMSVQAKPVGFKRNFVLCQRLNLKGSGKIIKRISS